jgi:large repetitive protein
VRAVVNGVYSVYSNTASASTVAFTVNINLNDGSAGAPAQASPWNNTNALFDPGFVLPNLINDQAQPTGINFGIVRGFSGFNTVGTSTGNNSGIYPDNVMKSLFYLNYADSAILVISGLNQTYLYNFSFFGSRANPVVGVTSIYRIGNQAVQLNASNNTSKTAQLNNIKPDGTGSVYISVSAAISGGFGYLNELSIQGVPNTDSAALAAANASRTGVRTGLAQDGLDLNATVQSLNVFPNPFQDDVILRLALKENVNKFTVLVTDMSGKTIFRKEFNNAPAGVWQQQLGLNARSLNKGIYLIQVAGIANEKPKIFKVIKY